MHLNHDTLSAYFGEGATGTSTVGIQGSTPAALVGRIAGAQFGPSWLDSTKIIYQDGGTGSGPWQLHTYDVTSTAVATADVSGQNFMAAGGGVWARWIAGAGVTASVSLTGGPTLADAYVWDVSPDGQIVLGNFQATATGLTVFNSSGAVILSLPNVTVTVPVVQLRSNILSYADATGWHLVNVTTGQTPHWFPRIDGVNWVVPVVLANGKLVVVERTSVLSVRYAAKAAGFIIEPDPIAYNPDALEFSAGVVRAAYATDLGESVASLKMIDVTLATGANQVGTVSGGTVVFTPGTAFTPTTFPVGPAEGSDLDNGIIPPFVEPVVDPRTNQRMTLPWQGWARSITSGLQTVANFAQNIPSQIAQAAGFGKVAVSGQPTVAATIPNDTVTLASADGTIGTTTNPATKTIDRKVVPQGPDQAVQYNANGTLGGSADLTFDYSGVGRLTVNAAPNAGQDALSLQHVGTTVVSVDVGVLSATTDFQQIGFGMSDYVATGEEPAYLWHSVDTAANGGMGFEILTDETVGQPLTYNKGEGFAFRSDLATVAAERHALLVYQYGGNGAGQPGMMVSAGRNDSGGGATGVLGVVMKDGNARYIWFRAADGLPVWGTSRPVEGGAETGTSFGNTTATYLTATDETADLPNSRELVAGTGVAFDDSVPGVRTVDVTAAVATATFLTATDETADLPNSRELVAGTDITFDDSTPGQRVINASGGSSGGGGWIEGLMRAVGDGATTDFALPDVAESLLFASVAGAVVDPLTYALSGSDDAISFDVAPSAGDVVTVNYVTASA